MDKISLPRSLPVVRAVIFDMDGLLIDSEPIWNVALDAFCQQRGVRYTEENAAACMGRGIPFCATYLAEQYRWPLELEAHVQAICDEFATRVPQAAACRGAEELLRGLHGSFPLGLATSSPHWLVEIALASRGWLPLFDVIVTGSDVRHHKPAPDIYVEAARQLGYPPEECLAFEDSPVGCQAAIAAGIFVVAIPGMHGEHPSANLVAPNLRAAAKILSLF